MSYKERCKLLGWSKLKCLREHLPFVECCKAISKLSYLHTIYSAFKYSFVSIIKDGTSCLTTFCEMMNEHLTFL